MCDENSCNVFLLLFMALWVLISATLFRRAVMALWHAFLFLGLRFFPPFFLFFAWWPPLLFLVRIFFRLFKDSYLHDEFWRMMGMMEQISEPFHPYILHRLARRITYIQGLHRDRDIRITPSSCPAPGFRINSGTGIDMYGYCTST
jgi:hypothetical protein